MRRFLYDTNVFIYAIGGEHRYRQPCRTLVDAQRRGRLGGEASVELVQELTHLLVRRRGSTPAALAPARSTARLVSRLHDFERRDLELAMTLVERHDDLDTRDAVHAATALNRGIDTIVSTDRDLDAVPGLIRVDPAEESAVAELAG